MSPSTWFCFPSHSLTNEGEEDVVDVVVVVVVALSLTDILLNEECSVLRGLVVGAF